MSGEDPLVYESPGFNSIICQSLQRKEPILDLASNYFKIDLNKAKEVYHYELKLEYVDGKDIYTELSSR
jgi:hypothetical protein